MPIFKGPTVVPEEEALQTPLLEDKPKGKIFKGPTAVPTGANFDLVQDLNPDTEADIKKTADQTGHSPSVIREDPAIFKSMAEVQKAKGIASQNKAVGIFTGNFEDAALVKDDLEALAEVEKVVRDPLYDSLDMFAPEFHPAIAGAGKSLLKTIGKAVPSLTATVLDVAAWGFGTMAQQQDLFFGELKYGAKRPAAELERLSLEGSKNIKEFLAKEELLNLPPELQGRLWDNPQYLLDPEWMTMNVGEVGISLIPVLAAAYTGGAGVGALVGSLMEGGDLYQQLRDQGISREDASTAGMVFGAVVGKLNKIGLDRMLKKIPTGSALTRMLHRSITGATEGATEWAEEPFQAGIAAIAQGKSLDEAADEVIASLTNVEVIPGSIILGGGLNSSISEAVAAKDKTAGYLEHQRKISEAVNETKTKERSPDAVKRFLKTAGLGDEAFLTADGVWTLYQADPKLATELLTKIGVNPEEAIDAARAGQTVQVSTSSLHAELSPEEFAHISEDLKPAPGAYSQKEIQARIATDEVSRLTELYAEAEKNEAEFEEELENTREQFIAAVAGLSQFENENIEELADEVANVQRQRANVMEILEGADRVDYLRRVNIQQGYAYPGSPSTGSTSLHDGFSFLNIGKHSQGPIDVPPSPFPDSESAKAAEAFNAAYPGHGIRFDAEQPTYDGGPVLYQYTVFGGPLKEATFNADNPTLEGMKTAYKRMLRNWKEDVTFEQEGIERLRAFEVLADNGSSIDIWMNVEGARRATAAMNGRVMKEVLLERDPHEGPIWSLYETAPREDSDYQVISTHTDRMEAIDEMTRLENENGLNYHLVQDEDRVPQRFEIYDKQGVRVHTMRGKTFDEVERIWGDPDHTIKTIYYSTKNPVPMETERKIEQWNVFSANGEVYDTLPTLEQAQDAVDGLMGSGYIEAQYEVLPIEDDAETLMNAAKSKYTLKMFDDPMLKGKEGKQVKLETIVQVTRQKGTPKIVKETIGQVMVNELNMNPEKGQEVHKFLTDGKVTPAIKEEILDITVDYDVFKASVEGALMPLDPVDTTKWADYGLSNLGYRVGDYDKIESIVYNSPIPHGFGDHFNDMFETDKRHEIREWEIKEVPQRPGVFIAMDKNRPATNDPHELLPYLGGGGSREQVQKWIEEYNTRILIEKAGVFGHVRRMDRAEDLGLQYRAMVRYLTEMQADPFQKKNIAQLLTQFVLEHPEGRAQKKLLKKMEKAQKKIEAAPFDVKEAFDTAEMLVKKIARGKEQIGNLNEQKVELEAAGEKAQKEGKDYFNVSFIYGEVPLMELHTHLLHRTNAIEKKKKTIDVIQARLKVIPKGGELSVDAIAKIRANDKEIEELDKNIEIYRSEVYPDDQPEARAFALSEVERLSQMRDNYEFANKQLEEENIKLPVRFEKDYEKLFYATRDAEKLKKSVPQVFTPVQKQFVAHRKNYNERLLREEIRAAAIDGKTHLRVGTPRTVSVIEGYLRIRPENAEVGEFNGMYEVTSGDPDALEPGDTLDYLDEEWTVVEKADMGSLVAVKTSDVNTMYYNDFVMQEQESAWENTGYDLEREGDLQIYVTRIAPEQDPTEQLLPGMPEPLEQEDPPGEEVARTDEFIISMDEHGSDAYFGNLSGDDVNTAVKDYVEDNADEMVENAGAEYADDLDGEITEDDIQYEDTFSPYDVLDDVLYDVVSKQVDEEFNDATDVASYWEDATGESAWGDNRTGTVYYTDGEYETLPTPDEVEAEPLDEGEVREEDLRGDTEEFDIDDVSEDYHVILNKYEATGKLMEKLYPDSFKKVKDDKGWWWYQIDIDPAEKDKPVQLFQAARGNVVSVGDQYTISLFSKADPSTVFHELGHVFMMEMKAHVESGRVTDQVMKDYKAILKWVGSKDGNLTREQHEKFARGFELYLMEGKSPTMEMERSFSRLRRWMVNIYKKAKALDVKMTDQMRGIFDRMLMVEVDVAKAANIHGFTVKSQAEMDAMGVIPEDQRYMKRLIQDAKRDAESRMLKAIAKGHKKNKDRWLSEATKQVTANPVYQVMDTIQQSKGLDRDALVDVYGPEILELLPPGWYRKENGIHPDFIAYHAGFDSGETMLGQILAAMPKSEAIKQVYNAKKKAHDEQFKAEDFLFGTKAYGDYLTVVNKYYDSPVAEQAKKVDPMVKADGKPRSKPAPPKTLTREGLKRQARTVMGSKSVRDAIRHDRYMVAMKRAQNAETQAVLAGDMLAASKAAEQVRFNYELAALALKNRKVVDTFLRNVKVAAGSKGISIPYREQIRQLIWRFSLAEGIAPQRPDALHPMTDLIKGDGHAAPFPAADFILNESIKDYHDLSFDQFTDVADLVRYLTGRGRSIEKAYLADGKTKVEDAAEESAEESRHLPRKQVRDRFSVLRKMNDYTRLFFSRLDSLNFVLIAKGAYQSVGRKGVRSATETLILDPLIESQNNRDVMHEMMYARMQPHLNQIHKTMHEWGKRFGRKIRIEGTPLPAIYAKVGQVGYWTSDQIFAVILNIGNQSNYDRLLKGYPGLTPTNVKTLVNMLSVEDMAAVQGIWDAINSLYPDLDRVHTKMNNFHMSKIQGRGFTFKGKEFAGGYYPVNFDPALSRKVATFSEADDMMSRSEAIRQVPKSKSGMTVTRKEGVALPLLLSLGVATRHINDTIQYITHAEAVRDADRITQHEAFAEETTELLGKDVYDMIRASLKHIARPTRSPVDPQIDRWVERGRMATTAFILGLNASVAAKQMFSSPSAAFNMGPIHYIKGFKKVMDGPADAYKMMMEMSPYMRQRAKTMDRELQDFFNKMSPGQKAVWFGDKSYTWNDVRNIGFAPIRLVDMATVIPIWRGAFDKMLKQTDGDLDAAIFYADDIVRGTQPSAQPLDMTNWQRAGGYFRFASLFQTFTVGKYGQRQRLHYRAMKAGAINKGEYAWFNITDAVLPGIMMNMMFAFIWGKDFDEETLKEVGMEFLMYWMFTGVPLIGQFFSKFGGPLDSPMKAIFDLLQRSIKDGFKYVETRSPEDLRKLAWDLAHISSFAAGIPVSKVVQKAVKGHEQDPGYVPGIEYLIPAPKK